jgi:DNA replicative helicase MCM subunit Mcm2 (Cdc46/Mcm family)
MLSLASYPPGIIMLVPGGFMFMSESLYICNECNSQMRWKVKDGKEMLICDNCEDEE